MLNEVRVKIKLVRSKDALCLTEAYKVRMRFLRCASMFVRKAKLSPFVFLGQAKTLERGTAKCPIRRVMCKSFTVPENYLDVSHVTKSCSPFNYPLAS